MSPSTFYFKTRLFFSVDDLKTKPQSKRFKGYSYTVFGEKITDVKNCFVQKR